jgi:hypothetical protein
MRDVSLSIRCMCVDVLQIVFILTTLLVLQHKQFMFRSFRYVQNISQHIGYINT